MSENFEIEKAPKRKEINLANGENCLGGGESKAKTKKAKTAAGEEEEKPASTFDHAERLRQKMAFKEAGFKVG